ncbi:alpha/beta hydrolase [Bradyrhizobium sp. CCGB01]|nr:alpha/beta hydrolase [Bradyrhizobium sp. CCGB01]MCP3404745.1 alpha/beta hydrolase [Bradyrhizobium sp. CCGB01]
MLDADLWREVRPVLERHGQVFDADTTLDGSIEAMADRAVAKLTGPTIVIGFSMGGYVAREIAYRAPDKVSSLALVATSARGDRGSRHGSGSDAPRFQRLSRAAVAASLHPDHQTDELIARVQQMSARLGNAVFQRQSKMVRHADAHRLAEIRCPTVVVAAASDALRRVTESEVLHVGIVGSSLAVIERSGHLIPLEQPAALVHALLPILGA